MDLNVNDTIVAHPTADDIARALAAKSFPDDWFVALETDDGTSLDALPDGDGTFTITYADDHLRRKAQGLDAAAVQAVFVKYLNGDADWDRDCPWHVPGAAAPKMRFVPAKFVTLRGDKGDQPPMPAMIVLVVIISLVGIIIAIENWVPGAIRDHFPYGDSDFFWAGLIFLPMVALVVVMSVTKFVQFRAAQGWAQTTGRILNASVEVHRHKFEGEPETVKNVPAIQYEFQAGARKVIGSRIGIGDDALADPEATLKRYPVGATVTVYYDADDPTECVLERGGPDISKRELRSGCASGLAILAAFGAAIYWMFTYGPDTIAKHFPHHKADPRFSIFATCFGLAALLFFFGARRYSKQAASWPSVRGKIVTSKVEQFQERDGNGRSHTSYRPAVEYTYTLNGHELHGNQIKLMMQVSGSESMAAATVAKYPKDSTVAVHYDPADPTKSALENPTGATWLIAVIALAMFALAAWSLGVFG